MTSDTLVRANRLSDKIGAVRAELGRLELLRSNAYKDFFLAGYSPSCDVTRVEIPNAHPQIFVTLLTGLYQDELLKLEKEFKDLGA